MLATILEDALGTLVLLAVPISAGFLYALRVAPRWQVLVTLVVAADTVIGLIAIAIVSIGSNWYGAAVFGAFVALAGFGTLLGRRARRHHQPA
jgi:hypothetical protein